MNVEKTREYLKSIKISLEERLIKVKELQKAASESKDETKIERCGQRINEINRNLSIADSKIQYMRENSEEDLKLRSEIIKEYPHLIRSVIPDEIPLVFHGNNNIGIVHEIIKSGGLKTCKELNLDYLSFATQIDVGNKYDIHVPCEFAEPGSSSFMPYGAIFVFYPLTIEIPEVLKESGSEVFGGVSGISFKEENDRFVGIITTEENKERVAKWLDESGMDYTKVYTHKEFYELCVEKYSNVTMHQ